MGRSQAGDRRDVERFLAQWFQLEERQAYPEIYSRLSRRFKAELRKEENVQTAAGYARLRRSSEARWFGFELREIKMGSPAHAEALLRATNEETGERETVAVRCVLRREGGRWTLDAWDY